MRQTGEWCYRWMRIAAIIQLAAGKSGILVSSSLANRTVT
jgi:hypothetical protein